MSIFTEKLRLLTVCNRITWEMDNLEKIFWLFS